jgi:hypothetical protein
MTKESSNAALDEPVIDTPETIENQDDPVVEESPSGSATETKPEDGFQKRINKITADKYSEKRRADDLQRQIDELKAKPAETSVKAPTLDDFDHDDEAFNAANIKYQVGQAVKEESVKLQQGQEKLKQQQSHSDFENRIADFNKNDFDEVANSVPQLPDGVANELMNSDIGPELIYHLGTHLDVADKLASMTPNAAMMELGRISTNMNAKKEIKLSAAPDPIEPLSSGSNINNATIYDGPSGATFE